MDIVVAALTTGIDATVSQVQQTAHQSSSSRQPSRLSNLLRVKQINIKDEQDRQRHCRQQAGKVRRDFERDEEHVDQDLLDEGFSLQRTLNQPKQSARRSARRTALLVEPVCNYSHIPMTVNEELMSNTKHVQVQKGAITLTLFLGPPRDIEKTTLQQPQRVGALPWFYPGHQGTSVGPSKDTNGTPMPAREGTRWPTTRSTVRQTCITNRQATLSLTAYIYHHFSDGKYFFE